MLGTASEPAVQAEWEAMAREYAQGGDARLVLRYDEGLAHRIYAGADALLVGRGGGGKGDHRGMGRGTDRHLRCCPSPHSMPAQANPSI